MRKIRPRIQGNLDATLKGARAVLKKARDEARGQERSLRTHQADLAVWKSESVDSAVERLRKMKGGA